MAKVKSCGRPWLKTVPEVKCELERGHGLQHHATWKNGTKIWWYIGDEAQRRENTTDHQILPPR